MSNGRRSGPRGPRLSSAFPIDQAGEKDPEVIAKTETSKATESQTAQIEYLIHQSTLGVHFLFDKKDVARVMMVPTDEQEFFTLKNMERVQGLLTAFLEKSTLQAKERYLDSLGAMERDLMIRAYFHLVENTILANFDLKH
ncbi:MAG: hypothetical protein RBT63_11415 [Bdellovibrionales bacterium]|nr:hypothetical protein [Bdellovibrionales bacterium]